MPRRIAKCLLYALATLVLLSAIALLMSTIAQHMFASMQHWKIWRAEHYEHLLLWRIALYTVAVTFWIKLRPHVLSQPTSNLRRLISAEILAAVLILLLELSKFTTRQGA